VLRRRPSRREPFVDLRHDYLGPLNTCGDQFVCPGASLRSSEQIVSRLHVQARENRSHDSDHPFAALIHVPEFIIFALYSPCK
jgi:hypothetical protein